MDSGDHKIPLDPPLEKREDADDPTHLDEKVTRDEKRWMIGLLPKAQQQTTDNLQLTTCNRHTRTVVSL